MPKQQKINSPSRGGLWGIMGGTFDPIHFGHLIMAESVMHSVSADGMLFIPTRRHPFKSGAQLSDYHARIEMAALAINGNPRFRLEESLEQSGYTIDLIDYLQSKYPKARFFLPIGSDIIEEFESWHRYREIEERIRIIIAARPGYQTKLKDSDSLKSAERIVIPQYDISSSEIRKRVRMNMSIRYMVPESVRKLIRERELYAG